MTVAIAGGHGKIALRLAQLLSAEGHDVRSLIRNPDHADDVRAAGGAPVVIDLEDAGVGEVADAIEGADAVVFAAGAGPGSGAARKETMDYGGAVKLILAAEDQGVTHYVMVSSMGADPESDAGEMAPYQRAKGKADEALRSSALAWTIVRPGRLTDDPGTGRVTTTPTGATKSVSRDDVAAVLAEAITRRGPLAVTFDLLEGDQEIPAALDLLG